MRVRLAEKAEADLRDIGDWIARSDPGWAIDLTRELRAKCKALGDAPLAFPVMPEFEREQYRRRNVRPYAIIYRVFDTGVEVMRVLHGARHIERILSRKSRA